MKRTALLTLFLIYAAMIGANWVSENIFFRLPHLEDEVAYLFQARVFDHGDVYAPVEFEFPHYSDKLVRLPRHSYWQPFVIDCDAEDDANFHTNCYDAEKDMGKRFGKYPPGWPLLLAIGTKVHLPWVMNLYFAGLTVALMYRLGREIYGETTGVIAALFMTISPIALLLNGTYMAHTAAHFFVLLFIYGLWRIEKGRYAVRWGIAAGIALGMVFIMRPLTALGIGLPLVIYCGLRLAWLGVEQLKLHLKAWFPALARWHDRDGAISDAIWIYLGIWIVIGLYISEYSLAKLLGKVYKAIPDGWKDAFFDNSQTITAVMVTILLWLILVGATQWQRFWIQLRPLLVVAVFSGAVGSLYFAFNYAVTENPTVNIYRMVWAYDRVGFGIGYGQTKLGHSPQRGWRTMLRDTTCYSRDLLGWVEQPDNPPPGEPTGDNACKVDRRGYSWILLLPGLVLMRRRKWTVLLLAVGVSTIIVHIAYWIGAGVFSARYYFEATGVLLLVSAAGASGIANLLKPLKMENVLYTLLGIMVGASLIGFTPQRLDYVSGYSCTNLDYFKQIEQLRESPDKKVLVIGYGEQNGCKGKPSWRDYSTLIAVTDPYLEYDIVFLRDLNQRHLPNLLEYFSDRQVLLMMHNKIYPLTSEEAESAINQADG